MPTSGDQYVWSGPASGSWGVAANWTDATTSSPATSPPDSSNPVTINSLGPNVTQTITGTGSSAELTIDGNTSLAGTFTATGLTLADTGWVNLQIQSGASLRDSGDATLGSEDDVTVLGGVFTVTGIFSGGRVGSQSGARVQVGALSNTNASVDATSWFEVGTVGGAKVGVFTVDAGATANSVGVGALSLANAGTITGGLIYTNEVDNTGSIVGAQFHAFGDSVDMSFNNSGSITLTGDWLPGSLVDNGVVIADPSTTGLNNMVSDVTGTGQLQIAAGGDLTTGTVGAGITVAFTGSGASLDISSTSLDSAKTYDAQITGFQAGDVIDYFGKVTKATYNASNGVLSLANGSTVVAKLHLVGDYSGDTFSATALTSGATLISVGGGGDTSTPPAGTTTADQYVWSGPTPGSWDSAANWTDTTTSSNPAAVAPGIQDSVTINSGTPQIPQVITGTGNSAELTIGGDTTLAGTFSTGALDVATSGSSLTVQSSASLTVSGDATTSGGLDATGGSVRVGGTLTGEVSASNGGTVQVGALTGSAGVDQTSSIEVGTAGGARAGVFTIDAGATAVGGVDAPAIVNHGTMTNSGGGHVVDYTGAVTNTGSIYGVDFHALNDNVNLSFNNSGTITLTGDWLAGPVVNNGVVIAALSTTGLNNMVGPVTGTGQLQIGPGGDLSTGTVGSGQTVAFTGAGASLDISSGSLDGAKTYDAKISGFAAGDVIDYAGKVTQATYNAGNGVLSLANGSTVVAKLHLVGNYTGAIFTATALTSGGTLISVGGGGDTSTPPAGTTTADQYVWSGPSPGSWDVAGNWTDTTTSSNPAAVAPGAHDSVTINSGTYQLPQVITGTGDSAELTIGGDTTLSGKFTTGGLSVSSGETLTVQSKGSLNDSGGASGAVIATGGSIKIGGTLTGVVSASNGGKVQVGALTGGAGVDATSSIEVGTKGGAKAGAFTVDAGATAVGGVDALAIINHGTMTNSGGGHVVDYTGAVTNTGSIYGVDFHALNDNVNLSFNNSGTITLTGDWLAGPVVNNGVVIAALSTTGLNSMVGDVTGKGQLQIATGGELSTGHVAAGETVAFTGSSGILAISSASLDSAKTYDAKITGFAVGDAIDFGAVVTSASYNSSNGILSLHNGSAVVAKLHLVGDYSGAAFQTAAVDGGAQITVSAGSAGHDTFVFAALSDSPVSAPDLISDFVSGDKIDLSAIDANAAQAGDQAFHFGATSGHAGDIVAHYDAAHGRTVIDLYVNGDAKADAEIWLAGNHALSASDFVL